MRYCPINLEIIPLPGQLFDISVSARRIMSVHSATVFPAETPTNIKSIYLWDVCAISLPWRRSKTRGWILRCKAHAESHRGHCAAGLQYNIDKAGERNYRKWQARCVEPFERNAFCKKLLFTDYNLTTNFEQYVLLAVALFVLISWLREHDSNEISAFENNQLLWRRTAQ